MRDSEINTLVLFADYTNRLSYYDDWLDAFTRSPLFRTQTLNIAARGVAAELSKASADADLIVLLHSTNGDTTTYLEPLLSILADRKGLLLAFIGNEVNLPGSPIAAKRKALAAIRPEYIATQLLHEAGHYLFGDLAEHGVLAIPHALNPEAFRSEVPAGKRFIDIGVRAVRYLPHLGDDDRNRLHAFFAAHDFKSDLNVDISTLRLDRAGWAAFLNSCRGTISSEAGSWYIERDDRTMESIRRWTAEHHSHRGIIIANDSVLRRLGHKLPWWMRVVVRKLLSRGPVRHESTVAGELSFEEVYNRFFSNRPRAPVYGKCISSRHFDAIGTRTCQILLEGRYNDMLVPGEHYIALKSNFANIQEVMDLFMNPDHRKFVVDAAYDHALTHHTHTQRLLKIHETVASRSVISPANDAGFA